MKAEKSIEDKALALVNQARVVRGLASLSAIPKGRRRECHTCPIALALEVPFVGVSGARFLKVGDVATEEQWLILEAIASAWGTGHAHRFSGFVDMPRLLIEFIADFDKGRFPELEEVEGANVL